MIGDSNNGLDTLSEHIRLYDSKKEELLSQGLEGRYALVFPGEEIDHFATYGDALRQGYLRFELKPFLVKKIERIETVCTLFACAA